MTSFLLNQDFPFLSPSKTSIYEVKLLKCKSAQLFTTIGAKKIKKKTCLGAKLFQMKADVLRKMKINFLGL